MVRGGIVRIHTGGYRANRYCHRYNQNKALLFAQGRKAAESQIAKPRFVAHIGTPGSEIYRDRRGRMPSPGARNARDCGGAAKLCRERRIRLILPCREQHNAAHAGVAASRRPAYFADGR